MQRRSLLRTALCSAALAVLPCGHGAVGASEPSVPVLVVAVRLHLMDSDTNADLRTTLVEADLERILWKVNGIWAQAGIRFHLESVRHTKAVEAGEVSSVPNKRYQDFPRSVPADAVCATALNVFYVKNLAPNGFFYGTGIVVKDTAKLKAVPGGLDEPIPRVTAHELGHALGLGHRQDGNNLMASGLNAYLLNEAEIKTAREKARAIQMKPATP